MYVKIHNRFEQYKQDRDRNVRDEDDDMSYIDADSLSKKTKKQGRSDPEIAYRKKLEEKDDPPKRKRTSRKPDKPYLPPKQYPVKKVKPKESLGKTSPASSKQVFSQLSSTAPPMADLLKDFVKPSAREAKPSRRAATKHLRPPVEPDGPHHKTPPSSIKKKRDVLPSDFATPPRPAPPATPRTSGRPRKAPNKYTPP